MNSVDTSVHDRQLRSKRVRNASTNDDSVKLPATKKRRSALRRDTFEPLIESSVNEIANQDRAQSQSQSQSQPRIEPKTNGTTIKPTRDVAPQNTGHTRDLTLRGSKKSEKRTEKGVGSLVLTDTELYTIHQLPALPERIRLQPKVKYTCIISPEHDYILALTHTDALLWSYSATSSAPSSRELVTFKLPFPPAFAEDPLPIGAFTAKSANGEPGILVVSPKFGKIIYWETVTLASSYTVTQSSTAVEGSIPGMMHGEIVKELVPAEPIGFILSLASGRVAHLTVRDQLGRPGIGIQYMRRQAAASLRGGIFGSIRHVFGSDRRKGAAIVRPGKSARAQRDIVICTEDADLEFWTNNLLTGNILTKSFSIREQLSSIIQSSAENAHTTFRVIDFAIASTPISQDLVYPDSPDSINLIFLLAASHEHDCSYHLVEATVSTDGDTQVRVAHPIRDYSSKVSEKTDFRPRISIPESSAVSFVLFDKAIVIASLAKIAESPSSQLVADKGPLPLPFQDCIPLRDDQNHHIINFAAEENETITSCVVAIHGYGLVRIESHLKSDLDIEVETVVSQLDAKPRLEQAIFFGSKPENPFDLMRSFKSKYPPVQIRNAILNVSREIAKSSSKHIPKSSSSISEHLRSRARLLQQLAEYSLKVYPTCLNRADRFKLLWDAEQIAAAQALWRTQEKIQSSYPKIDRLDDQELTYFNFALITLSDKSKHAPKPEKGETDLIRHWLVHDVLRINDLLAELTEAVRELPEAAMHDPRLQTDFFLEGTELWTAAFQTAFRFREDAAAIYGLGDETFENGVLLAGYPLQLYEVWTSAKQQRDYGLGFVDDVCKFLDEWWTFSPVPQNGSTHAKIKKGKSLAEKPNGEPYDAPSKKSLEKLADRLPTQVELLIRIFNETHIRQRQTIAESGVSQESKDHEEDLLREDVRQIIGTTVLAIAKFNQNGALQLAEAQGDTDLLVELNYAHLEKLVLSQQSRHGTHEEVARKIEELRDHAETYFTRFGNSWAYSHFSSLVERGELGSLIDQGQSDGGTKQPFLSWFLETCLQEGRHVGKLTWINDVAGKQDYASACLMLEAVAHDEETDIWSQKTELCLAKLAGLAALENAQSTLNETKIDTIGTELRYLHIVESLVSYVNSVTYGAVDDAAATELVIDIFIPKSLRKSQSRRSLSATLKSLVKNERISLDQVVDALTLLDFSKANVEEIEIDLDDLMGEEHIFALRAIAIAPASEATEEHKSQLKKTVWRRLLIKDNWVELNKTAGKSDQQVEDAMRRTELFRSLVDCAKRSKEGGIGMEPLALSEIMEQELDEAKIPEETKAELATLKKYIEKARLREHYEAFLTEARDAVRAHFDQRGEKMAQTVSENDSNGVNGSYV